MRAQPETSTEADTRGFPRVLIVSSSVFNPYTGGGITLGNLFRGWPAESLAVAHTDSVAPDAVACRRYHRLDQDECGWVWPLRRLVRRAAPAPAGSEAVAESAPRSVLRSVPLRLARGLVARVVGEEGLQDHAHVSDPLRRFVSDFAPDVIYTLLGSLGFVRLVRELAGITGAPVAVHMMDDWPATRYRRGAMAGRFRRRLERELRPLLSRAALRMAISEPMCREFEARYGVPFLPFHNVLDLDTWRAGGRASWQAGPVVRFVYSGSIEPYAQLASLRDVAEAVAALHAEGRSVELHVHTPRHYLETCRAELERPPAVRFFPAPERDEIVPLLAGADVLVLPVNFDRHTADYIRLSFPTKVPAYLASGTPVLAYGPAGVAQIDLARAQGWGHVVDTRDPAALRRAIATLAGDAARRESLGRRGRQIAFAEHDAARVRPRFEDALREAARRARS